MLSLLLGHLSSNSTKDIGNKKSSKNENSNAEDGFIGGLRHDVVASDQEDGVVD